MNYRLDHSQYTFTPFSRSALRQEAQTWFRDQELKKHLLGIYHTTLRAARNGETNAFIPFAEVQDLSRFPISLDALPGTNRGLITHADLIHELQTIFPDVTITSVERKGTAQMVYQQPGILLDWSA